MVKLVVLISAIMCSSNGVLAVLVGSGLCGLYGAFVGGVSIWCPGLCDVVS